MRTREEKVRNRHKRSSSLHFVNLYMYVGGNLGEVEPSKMFVRAKLWRSEEGD